MKLKLRRNSIMPLLFIVFICLVLLPILAYYMDNMMEGFSNYSPPNFFDRILFTQGETDRNYKDSNGIPLDMSGQYGYCLGGKIECKGDTSLVKLGSYKYGITYSGLCSDKLTRPVCSDNHYGEDFTDSSMIEHYNKKDDIIGTMGIDGGINILDPLLYRGFVGPYSPYLPSSESAYYPFTSDSSLNKTFEYHYYDSSGKQHQVSNKGKCYLVDKENLASCNSYFYDLDKNYNGYGSSSSVSGTGSSNSKDDENDNDLNGYDEDENKYSSATTDDSTCGSKIPCIADFGTNVGDNLCCGQTGVLQNTKYVCPQNAPKCSNFKCGSKFGTCSA